MKEFRERRTEQLETKINQHLAQLKQEALQDGELVKWLENTLSQLETAEGEIKLRVNDLVAALKLGETQTATSAATAAERALTSAIEASEQAKEYNVKLRQRIVQEIAQLFNAKNEENCQTKKRWDI